MTDEQINIAIAEACGWSGFSSAGYAGSIQYGRKPLSSHASWELPNYCNDLNAIHEAEMSLPVEEFNGQEWDQSRSEYRWRLRLICLHPCHATARERAEAFLRTIGKWEDSES
jgi:hypothetical protein